MTGPTDADIDAILARLEPRGGDGAITYVFEQGELVPKDHPAVKACAHLFDPSSSERTGRGRHVDRSAGDRSVAPA